MMTRRKTRAAVMSFHRKRHSAHAAGGSGGLETAPDEKAHRAAIRGHHVGLKPFEVYVSRKLDEGFQQKLARAPALICIDHT
jgi:hypothetical protein